MLPLPLRHPVLFSALDCHHLSSSLRRLINIFQSSYIPARGAYDFVLMVLVVIVSVTLSAF